MQVLFDVVNIHIEEELEKIETTTTKGNYNRSKKLGYGVVRLLVWYWI